MARFGLAKDVEVEPWDTDPISIDKVRRCRLIMARDLDADHDFVLWGMRWIIACQEHGDSPLIGPPGTIWMAGYRGKAMLKRLQTLIECVKGDLLPVEREAIYARRTLESYFAE